MQHMRSARPINHPTANDYWRDEPATMKPRRRWKQARRCPNVRNRSCAELSPQRRPQPSVQAAQGRSKRTGARCAVRQVSSQVQLLDPRVELQLQVQLKHGGRRGQHSPFSATRPVGSIAGSWSFLERSTQQCARLCCAERQSGLLWLLWLLYLLSASVDLRGPLPQRPTLAAVQK